MSIVLGFYAAVSASRRKHAMCGSRAVQRGMVASGCCCLGYSICELLCDDGGLVDSSYLGEA
jgi:hypothetical protein